jgi:hypothetical protein
MRRHNDTTIDPVQKQMTEGTRILHSGAYDDGAMHSIIALRLCGRPHNKCYFISFRIIIES